MQKQFERTITHARQYLEEGLSIIPIKLPDKKPIRSWKKYQFDRIKLNDFYQISASVPDLENLGIGLVTGLISGNLEVIDIDEKHLAGISARYINEISSFYPEIFNKLRIHKTPSGGFHLIYRCEEVLGDGNKKLAFSTAEKGSQASIETRGEGGYIAYPPTLGYTIYQDNPIPVLSKQERDTLINVAKLLCNKPLQPKKPKNISRRNFNNYSTNPFEDFNQSQYAETILEEFGWKLDSENATYTHYTRPEKSRGVSASFIKEKRLYHIFTSSTELEPSTSYQPVTILAKLKFNDDYKETFKWLIDNGYGKLTKSYEKKVIQRSLTDKIDLPKNLSIEAQKEAKRLHKQKQDKYPAGIFWTGNIEDGYKINREMFLQVCTNLNFCTYQGKIMRKEGNMIAEVSIREFIDYLKEYIKEDDETIDFEIKDRYENFMQQSQKYIITRLDELERDDFLNSTRDTSYKFFQNGFLEITKKDIKLREYTETELYILKDRILQHSFEFASPEGLFTDFISKAVVPNKYLKSYLGFATHEYRDDISDYFLYSLDASYDPKLGGGSGKNLLSALVGRFTTYAKVPEAQTEVNEKLFNAWNGEKLFTISDCGEDFDLVALKGIVSEGGILKKLYKDMVAMKIDETPIIWLESNYSFKKTDGGVLRRLRTIEFTDFFSRCGGVDIHYGGKLFPTDWSESDWLSYYNYMSLCIQEYLKDRKLKQEKLTTTGWHKQFDYSFNQLTKQFIEENIEDWLSSYFVTREEFESQYDKFCNQNGINVRYRISSIKMNDALQEYCDHFNIEFNKNARESVLGTRQYGRTFKLIKEEEQAPF